MKIFRPLWRDGAFLVPQQFQQQARWDAHVADTVSHGSRPPVGYCARSLTRARSPFPGSTLPG